MVEQYGFGDDVLPRMLPALTLVAAAGLAWLVPLRTAGSWRWFLLGAALVVWAVASAYLRRRARFSRTTTVAILVAYVASRWPFPCCNSPSTAPSPRVAPS